MTAGGPWSVKGIDPNAREVAKDLARRSGMTLGEWLNQVILDDPASDFDDPPPRSVSYASPIEEPRHEPRFANHRFYEDEPPRPGPGDLARITTALERLSARIEAAESRSTLALSGIEESTAHTQRLLVGCGDKRLASHVEAYPNGPQPRLSGGTQKAEGILRLRAEFRV